jgi:hypothetical protein
LCEIFVESDFFVKFVVESDYLCEFLSSLIFCAIFFVESDYLCEIFCPVRLFVRNFFVESAYEYFCEMFAESNYFCDILCRFSVSLLAAVVFKKLT